MKCIKVGKRTRDKAFLLGEGEEGRLMIENMSVYRTQFLKQFEQSSKKPFLVVLPSFCVDLAQKNEILSNKSSCFAFTFKMPEGTSLFSSVGNTLFASDFTDVSFI